jgi:hypothetical protein
MFRSVRRSESSTDIMAEKRIHRRPQHQLPQHERTFHQAQHARYLQSLEREHDPPRKHDLGADLSVTDGGDTRPARFFKLGVQLNF